MAGTARSAAQTSPRQARALGKVEALDHGGHIVAGQASGLAIDSATLVRGSAVVTGASSVADGSTSSAKGMTTESTTRETFAALDKDPAAGAPTWVHAGTQRAEAGFQDPALGWVGVRAEMSDGGVHAALMPGSAAAAQELGGHLAGLNAYLQEQHTRVETLTLDPSSNHGSEPGSGEMQQGNGQNQGQGGSSESPSNYGPSPPEIGAVSSSVVSPPAGRTEAPLSVSPESGGHVSLMA
jgi:hypothetical protein